MSLESTQVFDIYCMTYFIVLANCATDVEESSCVSTPSCISAIRLSSYIFIPDLFPYFLQVRPYM